MWEEWVIDGSSDHGAPGLFTFIPVENIDSERPVFVIGVAMISDTPPAPGRLRGVVHEQGQEAVERFCEEHKEEIDRLRERLKQEGRG